MVDMAAYNRSCVQQLAGEIRYLPTMEFAADQRILAAL
jgi:hypothetical protein